MPGSATAGGLTAGQAEQAGAELGRIHAAFARLPASSGPAPQATQWIQRHAAVATLLGCLAEANELLMACR